MCTECSLVLIRLSGCFDTRENPFFSCLFLAIEGHWRKFSKTVQEATQ